MNDDQPGAAISRRKDDHLALAARDESRHLGSTGLRAYRLRHRALPGRDLSVVRLDTTFLGRDLRAPIIVSAMTGGSERARQVNERLAQAAEMQGVGMVLGSSRPMLVDPALAPTYRTAVRPPLLLANLGAVQLRLGVRPDDLERLVDDLAADGLVLHLNPLQEAIQRGGDTAFGGLVPLIAEAVRRLSPRPVVVKEVGFGLGPEDVEVLLETGVAAIDVAGAGGTNWATIEGARDPGSAEIAAAFGDWGWPTAVAVVEAAGLTRAAGVPLVASGGVTDGVEAAIALALGADVVGIARPLLVAALEDRAGAALTALVEQLRIAVWLTGHAHPGELGVRDLIAAEPRLGTRRGR